MVFPDSATDLNSRPSFSKDYEAFFDWAADHGGVPAEDFDLSFTIRSDKDESTLVTDVRVVVVKREPALGGRWIGVDAGGQPPHRSLHANLDNTPPTVTRSPGWDYPLSVSSSEQELFTVTATTQDCYCHWRVEVDVIAPNGEKVTVRVDDHGDPFKVTGTSRAGDRMTVE
ncbi:hypothetical protein O2V63_11890 [Modestobacter sp. VKM Ac-2977]|uniref:hypothetical protein n=1 Tax=Modestobacter sp. VKM Ac-2977 TaxID=3004131 RepID=UPI0022AB44B4|nr:hypothetical protein [Modestobacter sp. VKM Ac-2977]MCZ2821033.1 hypothetical protein [Modestobacter sp. VKM Ac-2977]